MQDAGIKCLHGSSQNSFLTRCHDRYIHTKTNHNSCTHSLRLKELKEEVRNRFETNFQNDVCKDTLGNPDDFSLAEFGFWFIAKRQGIVGYKMVKMIRDAFVFKISDIF